MFRRVMKGAGAIAGLLLVIAVGSPASAQEEPSGLRIEFEAKLKVPREQMEQVWDYLEQRYSDCAWLNQAGHEFRAEFGDEDFTDIYFDTPGLHLLKSANGVRHRSRVVKSGPAGRKDGRELLQLKLNRGDETGQARSEIKYKIIEPLQGEKDDSHPLLGLVDREDRQDCIAQLAALGVDAHSMRPVLTLQQNRRRVYINDQEGAFATLTLDDCHTESWGADIRWTEIELELNEIRFTAADEAAREGMQKVVVAIQRDLQSTFPEIRQDQTAKYNHAFTEIERASALPVRRLVAMGIGQEFLVLAGIALVGAVGAVGYVGWKRLRRRSREAAAAA